MMRCALLVGLLQLVHHAAAFVTPALLHAPTVSRARMQMSTPPLAIDISSMHSTQFGSDNLIALGTTGIKEADQLGMYITLHLLDDIAVSCSSLLLMMLQQARCTAH
jgi:hypothetical protein